MAEVPVPHQLLWLRAQLHRSYPSWQLLGFFRAGWLCLGWMGYRGGTGLLCGATDQLTSLTYQGLGSNPSRGRVCEWVSGGQGSGQAGEAAPAFLSSLPQGTSQVQDSLETLYITLYITSSRLSRDLAAVLRHAGGSCCLLRFLGFTSQPACKKW